MYPWVEVGPGGTWPDVHCPWTWTVPPQAAPLWHIDLGCLHTQLSIAEGKGTANSLRHALAEGWTCVCPKWSMDGGRHLVSCVVLNTVRTPNP